MALVRFAHFCYPPAAFKGLTSCSCTRSWYDSNASCVVILFASHRETPEPENSAPEGHLHRYHFVPMSFRRNIMKNWYAVEVCIS